MPSAPDRRASLLVFVAVLVAYLPSLGFGFVYDDAALIVDNPRLHSLAGLRAFWTEDIFASQGFVSEGNYYRPIVGTWLWFVAQFAGTGGLFWHLGSILWHALAALLTFGLGRRLGLGTLAATAGALFFALHPLAIQSVAWLSGVTDPMSTSFVLGACLLWLRLRRWRALALLLLFFAMLSSERAYASVGVLGLLLLLRPQDAWRPPFDPRRVATTTALILLPLAAALGLRSAVGIRLGGAIEGPGHLASIWTAPVLATEYLQNLLFPVELSVAYPVLFVDHLQPLSLVLPLLVGAALLWLAWGDRRRLFFLGAATGLFVTALDAALLPPDLLIADRYVYPALPFLGLLLGDVVHTLMTDGRRRQAAVLVGVVLLPLVALGPTNLWIWEDNLALYTRAHAVTPEHPKFAMNLSNEQRRRGLGDPDCALLRGAHESAVSGTWPGDDVKTAFNLGNCLRELERREDALPLYRHAATASNGVFYLARHNLVVSLLELERIEDAWDEAGLLIQEAPGWPEAWRLRAVTNVRMGRIEQAMNCYRKLLEIAPGDADAARKLQTLDGRLAAEPD